MRCFPAAFLLVVLGVSTLARAADKSEKPDDSWMQTYYQHPQPERFEAEVKKMQAAGSLQMESALPPTAAFFSRLFQAAAPAQLARGLKFIQSLPAEDQRVFLVALRWADTPATQDALRSMADQTKENAAGVSRLLDSKAPELDKISNPSASELDMCWGAFFATGDAMYALPVVRCAVLPTKEHTMNMSREAARWSFKSLCAVHPKLRQIRNDFHASASPEERRSLDESFRK